MSPWVSIFAQAAAAIPTSPPNQAPSSEVSSSQATLPPVPPSAPSTGAPVPPPVPAPSTTGPVTAPDTTPPPAPRSPPAPPTYQYVPPAYQYPLPSGASAFPPPASEKPRTALAVRFTGFPFYQRIFSVKATGWGGSFGVEATGENVFFVIELVAQKGETASGLAVFDICSPFTIGWHEGRLRLGGGPTVGYFSMTRATDDPFGGGREADILSAYVGIRAQVGVDIITFRADSALFMSGTAQYTGAKTASALLSLGLRLSLPKLPKVNATNGS